MDTNDPRFSALRNAVTDLRHRGAAVAPVRVATITGQYEALEARANGGGNGATPDSVTKLHENVERILAEVDQSDRLNGHDERHNGHDQAFTVLRERIGLVVEGTTLAHERIDGNEGRLDSIEASLKLHIASLALGALAGIIAGFTWAGTAHVAKGAKPAAYVFGIDFTSNWVAASFGLAIALLVMVAVDLLLKWAGRNNGAGGEEADVAENEVEEAKAPTPPRAPAPAAVA